MKYILLLNLFKKYRKVSSNASDSVIGDKKELEKQINVIGVFFNFKKTWFLNIECSRTGHFQ